MLERGFLYFVRNLNYFTWPGRSVANSDVRILGKLLLSHQPMSRVDVVDGGVCDDIFDMPVKPLGHIVV